MNTHNIFENNLFIKDIEIVSQNVKVIEFYTPLGESFDFNSEDIQLEYNYDILDKKDDPYDHVLLLQLKILKRTTEDKNMHLLAVLIEGNYKVLPDISMKQLENAKHFGSLNLAVSYLRTVIYNITSMTSSGGVFLPLINIEELHKARNEKVVEKSKKK